MLVIFMVKEKLITCLNLCFSLKKPEKFEKGALIMHIFGSITDEDREQLKKFGMENYVVEHSKVTSDQIVRFMRGANILYLPQGDDVKYSIPYKFYDYISVQRPILAVTSSGSATAEIINELGCGEAADISDSKSIYNALRNIVCSQKRIYI